MPIIMKRIKYQPKATLDEHIKSDFDFHVWEYLRDFIKPDFDFDQGYRLTEEEILEIFNLLYQQIEIIETNINKPATIREHLLSFKAPSTLSHNFIFIIRYYLYTVAEYDYSKYKFVLRNVEIKNVIRTIDELIIEQDSSKYSFEAMDKDEFLPLFDFEGILRESRLLNTREEKIEYFQHEKSKYLESEDIFSFKPGIPFDINCDLEVKRLQNLNEDEAISECIRLESFFKISEKTGAKTNLIRILNALYQLELIVKSNGKFPTKKEFMIAFGKLISHDLSKYHIILSQCLKEQPLEANLKVFEEMKQLIQKQHIDSK